MEILFRGKRVDSGEWVYGQLWVNRTATRETAHIVLDDGDMEKVEFSTVGQYTGLDDKNGKKIFVGDFVLVKDGLRYGDNYECVGIILVDDVRIVGLEDYTELEVIGNATDNPELME